VYKELKTGNVSLAVWLGRVGLPKRLYNHLQYQYSLGIELLQQDCYVQAEFLYLTLLYFATKKVVYWKLGIVLRIYGAYVPRF